MPEVWNVYPREGVGSLRFGMTHAEVARFDHVIGPLEETTEETLGNGMVVQNEFRGSGAPMCSFQDGRLTYISISQFDPIDFRFEDVSVFDDDLKRVYSTLGRAAGAAYWHIFSVVMPSLCVELVGFVMEYSNKEEPPIFESSKGGFTWPTLIMYSPDFPPFDDKKFIEISNQAAG